MKKSIRRLRNVLWSLLLSAAIIIESTAGASVVYAAEITDQQTAPDVSEITEESGEDQENLTEEEDENDGDNSGTEDGESGEDEKKDPEESDNQENESEENNDNTDDSDESEGGGQSNPDEDESDENGEGESEDSENDGKDSDEEPSIEAPDSDEEELEESEDPLAALESDDSSVAKDLEIMRAELDEWARETGRIPNGYHDVDYDVDNLTEPVKPSDDSFPRANMADTLPIKYDARDDKKVSPVKNQAGWGTCWAFSAVNSAESAYKILNGSYANLSETHLVNFFYNGNSGINLAGPNGGLSGDKTTALSASPVQQGGNSLFTTFALASWTGVANEADSSALVYPDADYTYEREVFPESIGGEYAYQDAMHLENAYWINLSDKNSVKKAVMEYGTVGVSYYADSYYDSDAYKYYINSSYSGPAVFYDPEHTGTNHAVAIVGWDDSFDRNNFQNTYCYALGKAYGYTDSSLQSLLPKENGAWLIKNSWGVNKFDGGYFWMSYENASLKNGTAFAFDFNNADNYDKIYQYDGSNGIYSLGGTSGVTAAAVYTAQDFEVIEAVGVGFASSSTDYTVKIYKNINNESNPESGELAATVTGKTSFEGFYTIPIEDAVCVGKGEKFAVVVSVKKNGGAYLFTDCSYNNGGWVKFTASTKNDKTYLKSGSTWRNVGKNDNYTFRIKAYTKNIDFSTLSSATDGDKVLRNDMLEAIATQVYTGEEVKPALTLVFNGDKLREGNDYEVKFSNNISVGTATAAITGKGEYKGEFTTTFTIAKKAITADMIADISGWTYDGTGYTPDIIVSNGSKPMVLNTDYTVKYNKTPLAAGTYTVTVTGKAPNYSGSAKKTFTVSKLDLNLDEADINLAYDDVEYSGAEKKPKVTVTYNDKPIAAANYTVKYTKNKAAGAATVTITGKGNCKGKVTKTFNINPKPLAESGVTVKNGTYTGSGVKPAVTVKDGKTTLKKNKDYKIVYSDNVDATDAAKVEVIGINNYAGTISKEFRIVPKTVAANQIKVEVVDAADGSYCTVTANGKKLDHVSKTDYDLAIYNPGSTAEAIDENSLEYKEKYDVYVTLKGNYQNANNKPAKFAKVACKKSVASFTVEFKNPADSTDTNTTSVTYNGKAQKPAILVKDEDGKTLAAKYYSVSYANNVNAGTAAITVTGKGDYSGTKEASFIIEPKKAVLKVSIPAQTYARKELTPAVTIMDGKTKLKAGRDYTVDGYSNNMEATSGDQKAEAEITLRNYERIIDEEGSTQTNFIEQFVINPAKITSVKLSGLSYYKGGEKVERTVTVKAGKLGLTDDDYTVDYKNHTGVSTSKVKASVTITGKGNFKGTMTVKYSITKEPLSKVKWSALESKAYTGSDIVQSISLTNSAGVAIPEDAYTVTYKNNKKVGTASVTIKPTKGSIYSGSATKKFKIAKADLNDVISTDEIGLYDKTYTGSKQTYTAAEIKNAIKGSVKGSLPTYKVSYSNNVNAGTATLILTGSGSYKGKINLNFKIKPRDLSEDVVKITLQSTSVSLESSSPALAKIKQAVYGKLKLKVNKDYTLSYVNSSKTGIAAVKVTGAGNYTGTKQIPYIVR